MTSGLCQVRPGQVSRFSVFLVVSIATDFTEVAKDARSTILEKKKIEHRGNTRRNTKVTKKYNSHKKKKSQRKEKLGECLSEFIKLKLTVLIDHCLSCLFTTSAIQGPTSPTRAGWYGPEYNSDSVIVFIKNQNRLRCSNLYFVKVC